MRPFCVETLEVFQRVLQIQLDQPTILACYIAAIDTCDDVCRMWVRSWTPAWSQCWPRHS